MNPHPATPEEVQHILDTYRGVIASCPNQYQVDYCYRCMVVSDGEEFKILEAFKNLGEEEFKKLYLGTAIEDLVDNLITLIQEKNWEGVSSIVHPFITMPVLAEENFEAWEAVILGFGDNGESVISKVLENQ